MTIWRWTALVGLVTMAIGFSFGMISGIHACGLPGEPILNFEFATTPGEVSALFPESCRAEHVVAQRWGLWLDSMGFIPAYTAFLILSLIGLRREGASAAQLLSGAGILLTLIAALSDQFENLQLFRILGSLPGSQPIIDLLIPAVRIKFGILAIVIALVGWLHLQQGGSRKIAGLIISAGGLWSLIGLFVERTWLSQGSALGWFALFFTTLILSIGTGRRAATDPVA